MQIDYKHDLPKYVVYEKLNSNLDKLKAMYGHLAEDVSLEWNDSHDVLHGKATREGEEFIADMQILEDKISFVGIKHPRIPFFLKGFVRSKIHKELDRILKD